MWEQDLAGIQAEYDSLTKKSADKLDVIKQRKLTREHIGHLEFVAENLKEQIENFTYSIQRIKDRKGDLFYRIENKIMAEGSALKILTRNLRIAVNINIEFKHRFFIKGLQEACRNPKTIILSRAARDSDVIVKINLDETAGSIHNWTDAVQSVRGMLGNGEGVKSSGPGDYDELAAIKSHFWAEKFYGPAREGKKVSKRKYNRKTKKYEQVDITARQVKKYWATMKARLEASGKPAPYWEIIDKGNSIMQGSGTPYPIAQPTDFTGKTIMEVRRLYRQIHLKNSQMLNEQIDSLVRSKRSVENELKGVLVELKEYKKLLSRQMEEGGRVTPEVMLYSRVIGSAERTGKKFSREKLETALRIVRDQGLGGLSLTAEGRLELTEPGQPRFRVSINSIINRFGL